MKRVISGIVIALIIVGVYSSKNISAETTSNELQEGRFILVMQTGRAIKNTRILK
ncbi:MAG: hypothetical protein AABW92_04710 [Nanoarchaeota archaeon]